MKRFQRILVGLDLTLEGDAVTPGSRRAALQAQWLAERAGAGLTFLHSTWADLFEDQNVIRQGPSPAGTEALEAITSEYDREGMPVELVVVEDRAWMDMIRRVQRGENDIVFVGRRNTLASRVLGSTARKLLRKCPCPVWVVDPDSELVHNVVLAATDLTPVGDLAVELAASVAGWHGCELHVIHAWQVPFEIQLSRKPETECEEELDAIQRNAEEHIREVLARTVPEVTPHLHCGCDSPSHAIRSGVEGLDADLLVMGTVSRGGVAGLLMGNTAERLLDRVECSLLTIKPADFISPIRPD